MHSLAESLAQVLGEAQAREVLRTAAVKLAIDAQGAGPEAEERVIDWLCEQAGLIGTAARHARRRKRSSVEPPTGSHSVSRSLTRQELIDELARALGNDKATELVHDACYIQGFAGPTLSAAQAATLLEALAEAGGVIGVTARFAKARLALTG
jgi:hypothetical protein